jgi:hypothetical protein
MADEPHASDYAGAGRERGKVFKQLQTAEKPDLPGKHSTLILPLRDMA